MNHKLSLKTADFYGRLLACVPEYARINFDDVFENFLDAYDADIKAEKSTPVEKPKSNRAWSPQKYKAHQRLLDCFIACKSPEEVCAAAIKLADVCKREADEQRTIPKVGEVYKSTTGTRYKIYGITTIKDVDDEDFVGVNLGITPKLPDLINPSEMLWTMTLSDFYNLPLMKEE